MGPLECGRVSEFAGMAPAPLTGLLGANYFGGQMGKGATE